jgi:anti-sigma regulatory factor (Ser/Thr protein kinase)
MEIFEINNDWDIGHTRRFIVEESKKLGFNSTEIGEISIVVTELCTNLIKHNAVEGVLIFNILNDEYGPGIEIISQDKGPGIKDVDEVIKNGVSSKGTMGGGVGAMKRLMDSFEIYSNYNNSEYMSFDSNHPKLDAIGTLIVLKKWVQNNSNFEENNIKFSLLSRPYPGMGVNGDYYYTKKFKDKYLFALIDGLGHGIEANLVSRLVPEIINDNTHKPIEEILKAINTGLFRTRGAVVGLVLIDTANGVFEYSAVGNIDCRYINNDKTERLIHVNGILGTFSTNKTKIYKRSYERGSIITMCTDGILTKWDFDSYLKENAHTPEDLANTILKDFGKNNDDATILVAFL